MVKKTAAAVLSTGRPLAIEPRESEYERSSSARLNAGTIEKDHGAAVLPVDENSRQRRDTH
jgi:hypothetical protein